ncbi:hypothetical protein BC830DRAFT_1133677 [Chytriomyces sp. MP71]|nr:hypothetical protein BC830DRAFT_1133677 [Chytriomyces sp. MP71]
MSTMFLPKWSCNVCGKGFRRRLFMLQHMTQTHGKACQFVCLAKDCGFMFPSAMELAVHSHEKRH